jgi:hypothetical protein
MGKPRQRFKERNLVALILAQNPCYTEVVSLKQIKGLQIDLVAGTWTLDGGTAKIGESGGGGIIGVYDRTKIKHLDAMVDDGREATEHRSGISDSD